MQRLRNGTPENPLPRLLQGKCDSELEVGDLG